MNIFTKIIFNIMLFIDTIELITNHKTMSTGELIACLLLMWLLTVTLTLGFVIDLYNYFKDVEIKEKQNGAK